jgi:hypothetical protein
MPKYKIVIDLGGEGLLNFQRTSDDILKVGKTLRALQYTFEGDRDKQVPEIRVYKNGREKDLSDFDEEFVRALRKSPDFGSALRKR